MFSDKVRDGTKVTNIRESYLVHPRSLLCAHGERQHHCSSSSGTNPALLKPLTQSLSTSQNDRCPAFWVYCRKHCPAPPGPGLCLLSFKLPYWEFSQQFKFYSELQGPWERYLFWGEMSKNEKEHSKQRFPLNPPFPRVLPLMTNFVPDRKNHRERRGGLWAY